MKDLFVWFWTAMIFLSILWYVVLFVYVGIKGGFEILRMMQALSDRSGPAQGDNIEEQGRRS